MRPSSGPGFSALVVPFVLCVLLLIGAAGFGVWAYMSRQDYKNNVDSKIGAAVEVAKQQESYTKDAQFAEQEKSPFRTYTGPAAYGSVTIKYPKTWSAYVVDDRSSTPFVDGYFNFSVVPDVGGQNSAFALRVQVVQQSYNTVLGEFQSYVKQAKTQIVPYKAQNVPSVVGSRVDGQLTSQRSGSMVVLPLRNMTLKIWTESPDFQRDFDSNILPNFTFSP